MADTISIAICSYTDVGPVIVNTDKEEKAYELVVGEPFDDEDMEWDCTIVDLKPNEVLRLDPYV